MDNETKEMVVKRIPLTINSKFSKGEISVNVKTLTGKTIEISVGSMTSVVDVKLMIEEQEGIPID